MSPPVALFCCVSFFFGKVTRCPKKKKKKKKWEELSQTFKSVQEGLQDELRESIGMFTHSFSFLIWSTHGDLGEFWRKQSFLRKAEFQQVIPKGLVLPLDFSLSTKIKGPGYCFFRKETLKEQEHSAGIRLEGAWASLEKPSIACNLGSAFHNSIRSCMRSCIAILHPFFYGFLSQEFPPFVTLFKTSRVGWQDCQQLDVMD